MSRVLLVCNRFPKFSESFIVHKFLGLLRLGWDVQVACNHSDEEQWAHFAHKLPRDHYSSHVHVVESFDRLVDQLRPDIVHFEFGHLARGRAGSAALARSRVVASFRGNDMNALGLDDPAYFDELWETVDGVHVLTERLFGRAVARGCKPGLPHVVIPPAVDAEFFVPASRSWGEAGTSERPLRILSVGRLHWMKGYSTSLHAVALLRERGRACEYRIAGAADYGEGMIETLFSIHDHGLQDDVELLGAVSQQEVKEQLDWADVLLHGAVSEGFCNAALEAQAMEVPVVCTDALAGNVLDGTTGLVAALRDPLGLAIRLECLAGDPELRRRLGDEGRRRALAEFRLEDQIAKFSDWYRSLVASEDSGHEARALRIELRRARSRLDELEFERQRLARDIERRESAEAMKDLVEEFVPDEDHVLVVSRGDPTLLEVGRAASHFPQSADGGYLGHHPASSAEAIAQLEELRERDAGFLVFPRTALWWLEHYRGLRDHLERRYLTLALDNESGAVFELRCADSEAVTRRDVA
jgi:colanic acid/amylovoran biosynthesis glycosyltransferase